MPERQISYQEWEKYQNWLKKRNNKGELKYDFWGRDLTRGSVVVLDGEVEPIIARSDYNQELQKREYRLFAGATVLEVLGESNIISTSDQQDAELISMIAGID